MVFVKGATLYTNPKQLMPQPTWEQVLIALGELDTDAASALQLVGEGEGVAMTVFGTRGKYHVEVAIDSEEFFSYGPTGPSSDEMVEIADETFAADQVFSDRDLLTAIVQAFWETGDRYDEKHWIREVQ